MNIREELQEIFRNVFFDDSIVITDDMTSNDIEDWDSLSHISLVGDIERHFNIEFTTEEIIDARNVGEFISVIKKKVE